MVVRPVCWAVAGFAAWALAGCGTNSNTALRESERQAFARSLFETATHVAVAQPGTRVCKMQTIGISEQDWIKGVVVDFDAGQLRVRIDDPGRFPRVIDGATITQGILIREEPSLWAPCF